MNPRMFVKPCQHRWVLVRRVVVADQIERLVDWRFAFNQFQERQPLLMTMAWGALADGRAIEWP